MKFINYAMATALACLAVVSSVNAETLPSNAIESVNVAQQGNEVALRIDLKEALASPPPGFSVANPAKIALDFQSTANGLGKNSQVFNQGDLRSMNVVQVGDRTRVVLNLVRNMNYKTRLDGKALYVTLSPIERLADSTAQRATRFAEESLVGSRHAVNDVVFRRGKGGEGRIVVDLSDTGTGIDIRQQGANLIVDFMKTNIPDRLRRKLDVTDFATPVTTVETKAFGDNVRMIITPKGLWEHNAYQSDNQFIVEVKRVVEDPNKLVQGSKVGYQGPRVSINYQNGDVRALLRLMAEELGLNAVISETVTGTTTLVLKDVPADQVIDIIFQQKGLDMRKKGNIIMIAPRDEIATREKLEFESKQQISELEPLKLEQFQLNYQKSADVARLLSGVAIAGGAVASSGGANPQRILSKRGSAVADPMSNILFINDIPSKLEEIRSFIAAIDIGARQVLIEARVVEANDTFNRDLGVKLGFINSKANELGGSGWNVVGGKMSPAVTSGTTTTPATLTQNSMVGVNLPSGASSGGTLALSLFNASVTRILNLELTALEKDGIGKIISSPRVITANNVKAKIEDGTEVPYITTQAATAGAAQTYTVSFKPAKLSLEVTPQITPEGTVRMMLVVKKEEPDWERAVAVNGFLNPPIKSSIVETSVVVENGGTVVIGGVFVTKSGNTVNKVPLLGDIPVLGWLFKTKSESVDRRELLVFITPRLMSDKMRFD
ncbi:type IV pilus secretin family protein [Ferribacterium limneticum]|uniref:type IV pilus secretin family protein n=1 Tax=Ferribacterium limneticum TaxID=76259 RepID=UPI001CFBCEF0|nr:type IV pilus secretin family protein [Ferribacterium limneticum]UCV28746.1 type IV pilus secretin PilQ [Ferribacterium limneticum]UCV32663.1 type IV pilus secretin PilQ [Ferribacterium limneticum]